MLHSLVIGITLSITSGSEFSKILSSSICTRLLTHPTASLLIGVVFHQLFEGLSLGVRISSLPNTRSGLRILLCCLFAVTMPIGIVIGLSSFRGGQHQPGASKFAQGLMVRMLWYHSSFALTENYNRPASQLGC